MNDALPRIETGVRNLDALLHRGLPKGAVSIFGGSPGAGKTILAQQICFQFVDLGVILRAKGLEESTRLIMDGANHRSRYGVEETVVDGVIPLSATEDGVERQRYLEVYKLRNTGHSTGRHEMAIGAGGVTVFPHHNAVAAPTKTGPTSRGRPKPRRRS